MKKIEVIEALPARGLAFGVFFGELRYLLSIAGRPRRSPSRFRRLVRILTLARSNVNRMSRSHVIITGTGRAGTTFLVQLLTRLGLDTGFDENTLEVLPAAREARFGAMDIFPAARAGLEMNIRAAGAPYIVKTPFLCDRVDEVLTSSVRIEHAIIPVRSFAAAAASRMHVQSLSTEGSDVGNPVPGGLWDADNVDDQVEVLREKFTKLIVALVRHDIPITFLGYPRLVRDPDYLYAKLKFLLNGIDQVLFQTAFHKTVRPEWLHHFTTDDC